MKANSIQPLPALHDLPSALRREGAIGVELEEGFIRDNARTFRGVTRGDDLVFSRTKP